MAVARRLSILISLLVLASCASKQAKKATAETKAVANVPPLVLTLPVGTRFSVRMPAAISSDDAVTGLPVEAELAAPIAAFAQTIAPRGSRVMTVISYASGEGLDGDGAEIAICAVKMILRGGKTVDIRSDEARFRSGPREARRREAVTLGFAADIQRSAKPAVIPEGAIIGFRLREPLQVTLDQQ